MKKTKNNYLFTFGLVLLSLLISCSDDEVPEAENVEEAIDQVTLTFSADGAANLVFKAIDPDVAGWANVEYDEIELKSNTEYTLDIKLEYTVENENITEEIEEEADEHIFFFSFTDGMFTSPSGDGNVDNREHPINYEDKDSNGFPLGLKTTWETGDAMADMTFNVMLKHQPDNQKTNTSDSKIGSSDIDLTWNISIID